jgi:hypothetical protein
MIYRTTEESMKLRYGISYIIDDHSYTIKIKYWSTRALMFRYRRKFGDFYFKHLKAGKCYA